jgi:hypothetical protein
MTIVVTDGEPVDLDGREYVPIRFTSSIPKETFRELARVVLHGNECIFSQPLKRWFCPLDGFHLMAAQTETFLSEYDVEDPGDKLARLYAKPTKK